MCCFNLLLITKITLFILFHFAFVVFCSTKPQFQNPYPSYPYPVNSESETENIGLNEDQISDYYSDSTFQPYSENANNLEDVINSLSPLANQNDPKFWYDLKNEDKLYIEKKEIGDQHVPKLQEPHRIQIVDQKETGFYSYITNNPFYIGLIIGGSVFGAIVIFGAGFCYYRISTRIQSTAKVDYKPPTNPRKKKITKLPSQSSQIDSKLASSAHMYHYQSQKQKMKHNAQPSRLPLNGRPNSENDVTSGDNSSEESENGEDCTIYECPGLAVPRPGENIIVRNPLFHSLNNQNDNDKSPNLTETNNIAEEYSNGVKDNNHIEQLNSDGKGENSQN